MGVNVRDATVAHADVLAHIHREASAEPWSLESITGLLSTPGAFALLAKNDSGEPLGFVIMRCGGGEAEVLTLATRPEVRRLGVGRALMKAALDKTQSVAVQTVFLEVAEDNLPARALYAALDFDAVGRRAGYYGRTGGPRVDAVVMKVSFS